jgi:hypothetical protein
MRLRLTNLLKVKWKMEYCNIKKIVIGLQRTVLKVMDIDSQYRHANPRNLRRPSKEIAKNYGLL